MVCEPDDPKDENAEDGEEPKKGHGGCGYVQPQIRKEALKLFAQYKKPKDDDDVRSPSCVFFAMSLMKPHRR
jgi:DNA-directed RNA polymerase II subunit RPB1